MDEELRRRLKEHDINYAVRICKDVRLQRVGTDVGYFMHKEDAMNVCSKLCQIYSSRPNSHMVVEI